MIVADSDIQAEALLHGRVKCEVCGHVHAASYHPESVALYCVNCDEVTRFKVMPRVSQQMMHDVYALMLHTFPIPRAG